MRAFCYARIAPSLVHARWRPVCVAAVLLLAAGAAPTQEQGLPGIVADLEGFASNLIEHGRDTYGPKTTPLFVCQLDTSTLSLPPADTTLYSPDRRGGAGPTMNNLQFDSGVLRLLDSLSEITGNAAYRDAVTAYLSYYLNRLPEPDTGFFPWGDHRGYDVLRDETMEALHEFKLINPPWDRLYAVNPGAVRRMLEALRLHVYDAERSWAFSRHFPSGQKIPHSMCSSGGAYIAAWAFLYEKTGDERYLTWARGLANYFWSVRDPETGLLASHPFDPAYPAMKENKRAMQRASRTEYMAQLAYYAPNLLLAAQRLGPDDGAVFRKQALAYVDAFTTRMAVGKNGAFHATFDLKKGTPLFPPIEQGWAFVSQQDGRFNWANSVLGLRAPMALAFTMRMADDARYESTVKRLLPLYALERFGPDAPRRDLPAGLMAQAIDSFVDLYVATGDGVWLERGIVLGRYARQHYLVDGWVICGPPILARYQDDQVDTWRLYSNRGGSGELALTLLRLHQVASGEEDTTAPNFMKYF